MHNISIIFNLLKVFIERLTDIFRLLPPFVRKCLLWIAASVIISLLFALL